MNNFLKQNIETPIHLPRNGYLNDRTIQLKAEYNYRIRAVTKNMIESNLSIVRNDNISYYDY